MRTDSHRTESKSKLIFQTAITSFTNKEMDITDVVFRDITERDYGIDCQIEIFEDDEPTGKFAFVQLKGTEKKIEKLVRTDEVSCSGISKSNLAYCKRDNIPVILVYVSTLDETFYYIDMQSVYSEIETQTGTIRIPVKNNNSNLKHLFETINSYYYDDDDILEPQTKYEVSSDYFILADGKHRVMDREGNPISEGIWEDNELIEGIEFDTIIRVVEGELIKTNKPDDPYDASENFKYENLVQYGKCSSLLWDPLFKVLSEFDINSFYVVDMNVNDGYEQMFNIRTLEEFLGEKEYRKLLKWIKKYGNM